MTPHYWAQIIHHAQKTQSPLVEGFTLALDIKDVSEIIQQSMSFSLKWWHMMHS